LNIRLTTLQRKVESNDEVDILRGGGELTWIEKWQKNMRDYKTAKERQGIVKIS